MSSPCRLNGENSRGKVQNVCGGSSARRPGPYEVQILDSDLRSKASATGAAEIRDYVTTLRATIELGSLVPGTYQLANQPDIAASMKRKGNASTTARESTILIDILSFQAGGPRRETLRG